MGCAGLQAQEAKLRDRFAGWWNGRIESLRSLPGNTNLMKERATLLDSFEYALRPIGLTYTRVEGLGSGA